MVRIIVVLLWVVGSVAASDYPAEQVRRAKESLEKAEAERENACRKYEALRSSDPFPDRLHSACADWGHIVSARKRKYKEAQAHAQRREQNPVPKPPPRPVPVLKKEGQPGGLSPDDAVERWQAENDKRREYVPTPQEVVPVSPPRPVPLGLASWNDTPPYPYRPDAWLYLKVVPLFLLACYCFYRAAKSK